MSRRWPRSSASRSRPLAPASCASATRPPARPMHAWICWSRSWLRTRCCRWTWAPITISICRAWTGFPTAAASPCSARAAIRKRSSCCGSTRLTGRSRVLLTERSEHWVPLHRELTFLQKTQQFIWASSRDGFQHLYLYGNDGKLIRPLTQGEFMVVGVTTDPAVRAVDERARRVYFTANLPSPVERQLFWVSLDAPGEPQRVTASAGTHGITMSRTARVFVDTFSNANTPPRVTLRRANGAVLTVLVANELDAAHPYGGFADEHVHAGIRHARGCRWADAAVQAAEATRARGRQTLPGAGRCVRRSRRATREQCLGQPVPPVPRAARLRGVHARQSRQRLARREIRDGARACAWAASKCRTR